MSERRAQVGEYVEIRARAKVLAVSDGHGLSYRVILPKGDYLYPRTIWLEPSECVVNDESETKPYAIKH